MTFTEKEKRLAQRIFKKARRTKPITRKEARKEAHEHMMAWGAQKKKRRK